MNESIKRRVYSIFYSDNGITSTMNNAYSFKLDTRKFWLVYDNKSLEDFKSFVLLTNYSC